MAEEPRDWTLVAVRSFAGLSALYDFIRIGSIPGGKSIRRLAIPASIAVER